MIIVKPFTVTPAALTATNVTETDATAWVSGTNYSTGNTVMYNHHVYEALQAVTGANNLLTPDTIPLYWLDLGATNRYKMFDTKVGNATTRTGTIQVTITPGKILNGVVLFNVEAATVRLEVIDPLTGTEYDETIDLLDLTGVTGWYSYFFTDIERTKSEIAFLDIPSIANADFRLTVDNGVATAQVGEAVFGTQVQLATTNFGTSIGIQDYSIKQTDDFGNFTIVERPYKYLADYDISIETTQVGFFRRTLASLRATPVVYIGDPDRTETIVYGFYKDFSVILSNPSLSDCTLQVEGLT